MIHLPSVRALARDIAKAAALGSVVAAVADYRAEVKRLRAKVREQEHDLDCIAKIASNLAEDLARAEREYESISTDPWVTYVNRISHPDITPEQREIEDEALLLATELDAATTADEVRYVMGEDA